MAGYTGPLRVVLQFTLFDWSLGEDILIAKACQDRTQDKASPYTVRPIGDPRGGSPLSDFSPKQAVEASLYEQ